MSCPTCGNVRNNADRSRAVCPNCPKGHEDPNADLLGFEFESEVGRARVTETPSWSTQYVYVECRWSMRADSVRTMKRLADG